MSTPKQCPFCKSIDIHYESSKGEFTCSEGHVLQENTAVAEVDYHNNMVTGQKGNQSGDYAMIKDSLGYKVNNHQIRKARVYKQIDQLASQLNLTEYHIIAAKRLYDMAHDRHFDVQQPGKFTQGRPTSHVVAAALYISCRLEKTPHLLIDFSDALQINLYVLGACYLKLVKYLNYDSKLPLIDPSLYIHRFCAKLEFGDKAKTVSSTALRLLQRMKRDWMTYGRRPNSLCGAAILIAARYHGFKRTTSQIVQAVHVSDETIRKRLEEFKKTTVAGLTREEFDRIDLENDIKEELDPPSFKRPVELIETAPLDKLVQMSQEAEKLLPDFADEIQYSESNFDGKNLAFDESPDKNNELVPLNDTTKYNSTCETYKETLSDVDDTEIQQFLLSEEEIQMKSILWRVINKDWIEEQEQKKKIQSQKRNPIKRRKKVNRDPVDASDPVTALQSSTKLSKRINTEAIKSLFGEDIQTKKMKSEYD